MTDCDTEPIDAVLEGRSGIQNPFNYIHAYIYPDSLHGVILAFRVSSEAPDFFRIRIRPIECFAGKVKDWITRYPRKI